MHIRKTSQAVVGLLAGATLLAGLSACSNSTSPGSTAGSGSSTPGSAATSNTAPVTMTFWHNGTGDKSQAYWQGVVAAFEKQEPNVTINIEVVQNEDLDGKLATAMQAGTTPDIFLQRGGGKLADMIAGGYVADITDAISPDVKAAYGDAAFGFDSIDGKIYAMPMSVQPEGLWYNQDLLTKAGVATTPTDLAGFNDMVSKLKAANIAPIALGAKDAWPAAHWYYSFALRECSKDVVQNLTSDKTLSDPCYLKAFQDVADLNATKPFNDGFLTTVAQQGAGSSAGLVANGKAAMELMGAWEPGVIGDLTPDKQNLASLRWFPFPSVDGGAGDPSAVMAGSDGYSCSSKAPEPACTDFLNFMANKQNSEGYATAYSTIPANPQAMDVVTDPALLEAGQAYSKAAYAILWFDTSLGQDVGNAVNNAVVSLLAGQTDPAGALKAMQDAVKNG
jgi:ABC-type glycerol-3-phosphate transport system substrate-binding protein